MIPTTAIRIIPRPAGALSRPVGLSSNLGQFILFHDAGTLYAYLSNGQAAWHIRARIGIAGFAVTDDNLYVQDGDVLCQYDADALHRDGEKLPINAISFRTAVPAGWSLEDGNSPATFDALFARNPPAPALTYSAPVARDSDDEVHVLRSDGTVFSVLLNLEAAIGAVRIQPTPFVPDEMVLYQQPQANGLPHLCWISGGKIASLLTGELEPAPEGLDAWRWRCLKASSDQPWQAFRGPDVSGFISAAKLNNDPAAVVVLRDSKTAQWTFHLVDPACYPVFTASGAMLVETAGNVVSHVNPGIPAGLVTSRPSANTHECAGAIKGIGGASVELSCAPYLHEESGILFAYLIVSDAGVPSLGKYRVPAAADDYVMAWWNTLKEARQRLQPVLASEIVYSLADSVQQAIDDRTISAAALAKAAPSLLWSATQQGIIPWAGFDAPAPTYVRLLSQAVFLTPIDVTTPVETFPIAPWGPVDRTPYPATPLSGPGLTNNVAMLRNAYLWLSFGLDGRLLSRISSSAFVPMGGGGAMGGDAMGGAIGGAPSRRLLDAWWPSQPDPLIPPQWPAHRPQVEVASTADWRPISGPLPLAAAGNPPDLILRNVAAVPINTDDGRTVAICGTPCFRQEGAGWFVYVCVIKTNQYYFAKFAIPN